VNKHLEQDPFWTEYLPLFTGRFPNSYTKPQKVFGRFHISKEYYLGSSSEIIPLKHRKGKRTHVMMQPIVYEPILALTVGLYTKPKHYAEETAIGKTIGAPKQEGVREVQLGNAQAWFYHEDKTLVLWECLFDDRFRKEPLEDDTNMLKIWQSFERWLIKKFSQAQTLATPSNDPLAQSIEEYQTFLKKVGYSPIADTAFGKHIVGNE
jgi:hypothetical protein